MQWTIPSTHTIPLRMNNYVLPSSDNNRDNNNNNKRSLTPKSMPPAGDEHAKLKT